MSPGRGREGLVEAWIRRTWGGRPVGVLRLASAAYGAVAGTRNLMYDSGIFAGQRAPVPLVSVGGLTVGGSGKTPITADIAARLGEAGVDAAILTHGFDDEMDVHHELAPKARVYGGPNRPRLAHRAAEQGAQIVLLDSGFQHRRLHRDIDVVTLDEASLAGSLALLPAGPFREPLAALERADLVVVVRRPIEVEDGAADNGFERGREGLSRLRDLAGSPRAPSFVWARIVPGRLLPANGSAQALDEPRPGVAVAGIMWPEVFFAQLRRVTGREHETIRLRDHARIDRALGDRLQEMARESGVACTRKDSGKLVRALGDSVPIWYLSEDVVWEDAGSTPTVIRTILALLDAQALDPNESFQT